MSATSYKSSFDGKGELAAGSVRGLRSWSTTPWPWIVDGRGLRRERMCGTPVSLTGQYGFTWRQGENVAHCGTPSQATTVFWPLQRLLHGAVPAEGCGCGFWAYWANFRALTLAADYPDVTGVIDGYGLTLIGELGFRCQKARIIALTIGDLPDGGCTQLRDRYQVPVYRDVSRMLDEHPVAEEYH